MKLSKSTLIFFGDVTAVILKAAGTTPERRESFNSKTTELTEEKHDLNKQVGTGSSIEVAAFICESSESRFSLDKAQSCMNI